MGSDLAPATVHGEGIAGRAAALILARLGYRVTLIGRDGGSGPSRLVSVPARLLPLLVELGVAPNSLGPLIAARTAKSAWETAAVERVEVGEKIHFDQARLELELGKLVGRHAAIRRLTGPIQTAEGRRIDASGRRALSSVERIEPKRIWHSRLWRGTGQLLAASEPFAIASLPSGYAFCIVNDGNWMVGLASPESQCRDFGEFQALLRDAGAGWLLHDILLDRAESPIEGGKGGISSVSWSVYCEEGFEPVGDALLAGDSLSSQGIAWALSDVMHLHMPWPVRAARAAEKRQSHLTMMLTLARSNRFANEPAWHDYARFLASEVNVSSAVKRTEYAHA